MKLTVRLPICVRGHVKGRRNRQDILATAPVEHDVPEVSRQETENALVVSHAYGPRGEVRRRAGPTILRYGNRLYRPMFPVADPNFDLRSAMDEALGKAWLNLTTGSDLSYVPKRERNLAAAVIHDYYGWLLDFHRRGTVFPVHAAWPPLSEQWDHAGAGRATMPTWRESRDECVWEELAPHIVDFEADDFAFWNGMKGAQLGKLLLVDGVMHYACQPPCIVVKAGAYEHTSVSDNAIHIRLATLPEWIEPDLSARYFPLDSLDKARDYAAHLDRTRETTYRYGGRTLRLDNDGIRDVVPPHEPGNLPSFVTADDTVWRTGMGLTRATVRYFGADPTRAAVLTSPQRATLDTAHAIALEYDPTSAVKGDFGDILGSLVDLWRGLGKPESKESDGAVHRHDAARNSILEATVGIADQRAISIFDVVSAGATR